MSSVDQIDCPQGGILISQLVGNKDDIEIVKRACLCKICGNILFIPKVCKTKKCDGVFCQGCIQLRLDQQLGCPICNEVWIDDAPTYFIDFLKGVKYQCCNFSKGCNEKLQYDNLLLHKLTCMYEKASCSSNKCQYTDLRIKVIEHEKACPYIEESCSFCGTLMKKIEIEKHYNICIMYLIQCQWCGKQIMRKDTNDHNEGCPEKEIECSRCQTVYKQKDKPLHDCIRELKNRQFNMMKSIEDMFNRLMDNKLKSYQDTLIDTFNQKVKESMADLSKLTPNFIPHDGIPTKEETKHYESNQCEHDGICNQCKEMMCLKCGSKLPTNSINQRDFATFSPHTDIKKEMKNREIETEYDNEPVRDSILYRSDSITQSMKRAKTVGNYEKNGNNHGGVDLSMNISTGLEWEFLRCRIPIASPKFKIAYKASEKGYSSQEFHKSCDGLNNTVVVVKTRKGYLFGGYCYSKWGKGGGFIKDEKAFLFSKNYSAIIEIKSDHIQNAILNRQGYGPTFGKGHDLAVADQCNIKPSKSNLGISYDLPQGVDSSCGKSYLAGEASFVVDDYYVYEVY